MSHVDHDTEVIRRWNEVVGPDDIVYHLGDVMLGNNEYGISCLKQLNGHIKIIPGNHDTQTRLDLYRMLDNVEVLGYAEMLKYKKYNFYLSHHPTLTSNLEKAPYLRMHLINLFGHTHQQKEFYNDIPFMFHVRMKDETQKCLDMLDTGEKVADEPSPAEKGEDQKCPTPSDTQTTTVPHLRRLFSKMSAGLRTTLKKLAVTTVK